VQRVSIPVSPPAYTRVNPSVFASLLVSLVRNRQIQEDLGSPLFADHIRALTASFDSKLADVGNPSSTATWQIITLTEGLPRRLTQKPRAAGASRPSPATTKLTKQIAFGANEPSAFRLPWLRFSVIFLSCKTSARVYDAKSGHCPHSLHQARRLHLSAWRKSLTPSLGSEPRQPTKRSLSLP